ncbi:MAG TPA: hypothetical protein VG125_23725 [Pirellulales bacterium]|nr:hypothetical protein [Pirellulales bacterium]
MQQQSFDFGPQGLITTTLCGNVCLALGRRGNLQGVKKDCFWCTLLGGHRGDSSQIGSNTYQCEKMKLTPPKNLDVF